MLSAVFLENFVKLSDQSYCLPPWDIRFPNILSPVHNTMQRVDAADSRIESYSIPMYIDAFYPCIAYVGLYCGPGLSPKAVVSVNQSRLD